MSASVRFGVNSLVLDTIVGKSIEELREEVAGLLNVPESAQVRINGNPASEESIVPEQGVVEFVKTAGEKGA